MKTPPKTIIVSKAYGILGERVKRVAAILIMTLLFFFLPPTAVAGSYTNVTVSEAKAMIDSKPSLVVLDVRAQSEYDSGHIGNAKLIPVGELGGRLDELNKTDEILVYCKSGGRSSTASQLLADNGFLYVYNMLGGITAWKNEGYYVYVKYSSIQEAINNANEGDAIFVSSGTYVENVIVNKTVSLIGEGQETTVIDGGGVSSVIKIKANNVVVEGFNIRNSGAWESGVEINGYNYTTIRDNSIIGNQVGILIRNSFYVNVIENTVTHSLYSVALDSGSSNNNLTGNNIRNSTFGIDVETDSNSFYGNDIRDNFYGISIGALRNSFQVVDINNNNVPGNPVYPNPCGNAAFRHALWHTIDRQYIINSIWKESWLPMYTPMPPSISQYIHTDIAPGGSLENLMHPYNLTEAERILDTAGFIDTDGDGWRNFPQAIGGDGKDIVLKYFIRKDYLGKDPSPRMDMGLWHAAQIEAIGIIVNVTLLVQSEVLEMMMKKGFHLYTGGWTFLGWDIACLLLYHSKYYSPPLKSPIGYNYDGVNSTEYDYWVDKCMEAKNVDDVKYAAIKAQETFNNPECVGAIPLIWHWDPPIEVVNNTISDNNLANNLYSINLVSSSQNLIYHNNFINNSRQLYSNSSINAWHSGYPTSGNYWSDYVGIDDFRGPNQDQLGSDGIGDTSYIIDANNTDHYPLMKPYGGPNDIGIPSIQSLKNTVGQGYNLFVTVKLINYGIGDETFDLIVYANTTSIASQTITLRSRNSTTIAFTWNTTGFDKGNYTISVYATPVTGETETEDNTFVNGEVCVTIPGDVDGDKDVDLYDVVKICSAYGSKKGDPEYVANCDVNGDDKIDLYDVVIACARYGEKV